MTFISKKNTELLKLRHDFLAYYNTYLHRDYQCLEETRKSCVKRFWIWSIFFSVLTVYLIYLHLNNTIDIRSIFKDNNSAKGYMYLIAIYFTVVYTIIKGPFITYKETTKNKVMQKVLDFIGYFQYNTGDISPKTLKDSKLFDNFDVTETDDKFYGTYKNTKISINEKKLLKYIKNKNPYDITVFKGIIIKLTTKHKYHFQTLIRHDKGLLKYLYHYNLKYYLHKMLPILLIPTPFLLLYHFTKDWKNTEHIIRYVLFGSLLMTIFLLILIIRQHVKHIPLISDLPRIPLEDIVFEKEWDVYGEDSIEARYILTPALMERMLKIRDIFYGNNIEFSFFDKNIIIAIPTNKDMFETTSLFNTATEFRLQFHVISQIYQILKLIDELKLK